MTDSLRRFLVAQDLGKQMLSNGDELARLALFVAHEARVCWEKSRILLEQAERCAMQYAHEVDVSRASERWPSGLEAAIREAIENRDAACP